MPRTTRAEPRWLRRPDERPQALMHAVMKRLRRDGYRRVRLEEIARDAGVSKATVYHYFKDKDDLLTRAVADRMAGKLDGVDRRLAAAGGTASARLRQFLNDYWRMSHSAQAGLWYRRLLGEIVVDAPDVFAAWARGLVERWRFVAALIVEGQKNGEFRRTVEPEAAARLVVSALSYQALFHVRFGVKRFAPYRSPELRDALIDAFFHSLGASSRRRPSR